MTLHLRVATLLFACAMVFGTGNVSSGETVPYFQSFDSIAVGGALPNAIIGSASGATTNTWAVVDGGGGNHRYENVLTTGKGFSSLQFPALGPATPANNFEVSTVLLPVSTDNPSGVNYTEGIRFLATGAGTTDDSFVADVNVGANGGRMRIVEWTGAAAAIYPSSTQSAQPLIPEFSPSKSYLLNVKGTYDASNALTVMFTATEVGSPANTMSYTYGPDTSPRTGQYFGFYNSMGSGGGTMKVDYDNFSVTPEPSSLALLGVSVAGLLLCAWRRREQMM